MQCYKAAFILSLLFCPFLASAAGVAIAGTRVIYTVQSHEADKRDARSCTRENRRGTPRGASGFAAARSLTTAERGGEPPPGTARYSRYERRLPFII